MTKFTVTVRGEDVEFDSAFDSLPAAIEFLRSLNPLPDTFAGSLLRTERLSVKQAAWVHKLATDVKQARDAKSPAIVPGLNLLPIVEMLHHAAEAQKRAPSIRLRHADGSPIEITLSQRSGKVWVASPETAGGNLFARIYDDGSVQPRNDFEFVRELLTALAANPEAVAKQHGVATGECCFCGRPLSTKESRSAGYGPICAEKFGLDWGSTTIADAENAGAVLPVTEVLK